jgi:hypothetical protein
MELAATSPLLLWLLSENHKVPQKQVEIALGSLESWVIRRTLLRMTMKDVNKTMVSILKLLDRTTIDTAGDTVRNFLASQQADARLWPQTTQCKAELPKFKLYGYLRQSRSASCWRQLRRSSTPCSTRTSSFRPGLRSNMSCPGHGIPIGILSHD